MKFGTLSRDIMSLSYSENNSLFKRTSENFHYFLQFSFGLGKKIIKRV